MAAPRNAPPASTPSPFQTDRQCEVMVWLVAFMDERGRPPSVRELAAGLGLRSTRSAADHLHRLHRLGAIERTPRTARGISVADPDLWRRVPRRRYAPTEPARYAG